MISAYMPVSCLMRSLRRRLYPTDDLCVDACILPDDLCVEVCILTDYLCVDAFILPDDLYLDDCILPDDLCVDACILTSAHASPPDQTINQFQN